jgi:SAM-dependent methyltransferase
MSVSTPRQVFADTSDDTWLWLNAVGRERIPELDAYLPGVPDPAAQLRLTVLSGRAALERAYAIYLLYKQLFIEHAGPFDESTVVLDFGCGWGRTIRFFLREVEPANLWGIDPSPHAIRACRDTNTWCHFQRSTPFPPSQFEPATFDLIYCWSVFSHLSEDCHLGWLAEFRKVLKPGGLLIASTLARHFIQSCADARNADLSAMDSVSAFKQRIRLAFEDTAQAEADYDSGKFVFSSEGSSRPHFGQACISELYVRARWTKHLDFVEYRDDRSYQQNVIVMRKPTAP